MKFCHTLILQILYITLCFSNDVFASTAFYTNSRNLFNSLTYEHNANIRPDSNVQVSVSLTVTSINYLDIATEQFSVTGWFSVKWIDNALAWTPSSFGNVNYLFLTKDYIWTPRLAVDNAADALELLNDDTQQMRVSELGSVDWEPGGVFTVHCDVDPTFFPYDIQTCYISLISVAYDNTEVTLSHNATSIKLDNAISSDEWVVIDTATETVDHNSDVPKTLLKFTLKLQRTASFYLWILLLPYFLISSLGLIVFILPSTKGEKSSFSLRIILLDVIFLVMLSSLTPLSKGKLPAISVYFILLFIINIFELLCSVIVERLYRNDRDERPISTKLQRLTYVMFSRMACYYRGENEFNDSLTQSPSNTPIYPRRFSMPKNTRVSPSSLPAIANHSNGMTGSRPRNGHHVFDRINSAQSTRTNSDITVSTDDSNASSTQPLQPYGIEYSWVDIARMVDRMCLGIYTVVEILLTAVFIGVLHLYHV